MTVTLEFVGARLDALQRDFRQVERDMRDMRDRLARTDENFNELRKLIGYQTDALLALDRRLSGFQDHVTDTMRVLHERQLSLEERIARMDERLGIVEERVGAVEQRVGAVEERLGNVERLLTLILDRLPAPPG